MLCGDRFRAHQCFVPVSGAVTHADLFVLLPTTFEKSTDVLRCGNSSSGQSSVYLKIIPCVFPQCTQAQLTRLCSFLFSGGLRMNKLAFGEREACFLFCFLPLLNHVLDETYFDGSRLRGN